MNASVIERIWAKVDTSAGVGQCWPWRGPKGGSGTATLIIQGRSRSVRRVLWQIVNGEIPDQNVISDTCGDRKCMNPAHLRLRSLVLAERFWGFVDKTAGPDACWPYMRYRHGHGSTAGNGYGSFPIGEKGKYQANRVAWMLTNGDIPDGMHVLHTCDNPSCCNPSHLRLGTHQDNMRDMIAKGRGRHQKNRPGYGQLGSRRVSEKRSEER